MITTALDQPAQAKDLVNWPVLYSEMDSSGLDALVAFSSGSTNYLSGCLNRKHLFVGGGPLSIVVVPRQGEPSYIVSATDEHRARSESWLRDIRTYPEHQGSPIEALANCLADKKLESSRIGIENSFLSVADHRELEHRVPGAAFVDGQSTLARARWTKTPAEIERIREAVLLGNEAVYAAWEQCRAGDTEKDVLARMIKALGERGSDRFMIFMASGDTTVQHHVATDRRLQAGDLFTCVFLSF